MRSIESTFGNTPRCVTTFYIDKHIPKLGNMRVCWQVFWGLYRPIRVGPSVFELSVILEYFYHTHRTIYEAHYNPPKSSRQGLCRKQTESNERFIVSKQ